MTIEIKTDLSETQGKQALQAIKSMEASLHEFTKGKYPPEQVQKLATHIVLTLSSPYLPPQFTDGYPLPEQSSWHKIKNLYYSNPVI